MSNTIFAQATAKHPAFSFTSLLAIGTMLATLAVIAYACLHTTDSALRAQIVLQGAGVTLIVVAAGVIANALHVFSLSSRFEQPSLLAA